MSEFCMNEKKSSAAIDSHEHRHKCEFVAYCVVLCVICIGKQIQEHVWPS